MIQDKLTTAKVRKIIVSFLKHIADNWQFYKNHLPHLRRTMMFYNEFAYGIRFLPENSNYKIEFNPKDPLLEDLAGIFGKSYCKEVRNLIYGAWPLRNDFRPWEGYEEPIADTPKALRKKCPDLFKTDEDAREYMHKITGAGYGNYNGRRVKMTSGGTPDIWYQGFTTVKEFPEQKKFLDSIRNNPRIKKGMALMEEQFLRDKAEEQKK